MNFTAVKKLDGTHLIASASVKAAGGGLYTVSDNALDVDGDPHLIFTPTVEVTQVQVVTFRLSEANNRVFQL